MMKTSHHSCLAGLSSRHIGATFHPQKVAIDEFFEVKLQVNVRYSCGKPKNTPLGVCYWVCRNFEICRVIIVTCPFQTDGFCIGPLFSESSRPESRHVVVFDLGLKMGDVPYPQHVAI